MPEKDSSNNKPIQTSSVALPPEKLVVEGLCPSVQLSDLVLPTNLIEPLKGLSSIFYINMDRSIDRETHMQSLFQHSVFKNIEITRISGIDGKKNDTDNYLDFYQCAKNPNMMSSEYGCTISHFRAIHHAAMTDDPYSLILEDDASIEFLPYWKKTIEQLVTDAPPDWEVIQLSYILFDTLPEKEYEVWEMKKSFCGTAAYLIKNSAAKRLIQYLCRNSSPAMPRYCIGYEYPYYHHADRFLYCFFKTYSYHCPFFTYRDHNDSYIHPDHVDFHSESKEKTKKLIGTYGIGTQGSNKTS